jgi:hypothetical protein
MNNRFLGTKEAGDLLQELLPSEKWSQNKVSQYLRQGTAFPEPDIYLGNRPGWKNGTIEKYANQRRILKDKGDENNVNDKN